MDAPIFTQEAPTKPWMPQFSLRKLPRNRGCPNFHSGSSHETVDAPIFRREANRQSKFLGLHLKILNKIDAVKSEILLHQHFKKRINPFFFARVVSQKFHVHL